MKVKRIVVDKLPYDCQGCQFMKYPDHVGQLCECVVEERMIRAGLSPRPEWCPLEIEHLHVTAELDGHTHTLDVHGWSMKNDYLSIEFEVKHE